MPRSPIFTASAFAQIARDVAAGKQAAEIARGLGCTVGTLRVRCSHAGVSLRPPGPRVRKPKPAPIVVPVATALAVELPLATARALAQHAEANGTTSGKLAIRLLETIATDNLYTAVLDDA